jgi:hypothetical protein
MIVLVWMWLMNAALAADTDTDLPADTSASDTDVDYSGSAAAQLAGEAGGSMSCAVGAPAGGIGAFGAMIAGVVVVCATRRSVARRRR